MVSTADFETWLSGFLRWRESVSPLLGSRLPSDVVALIAEKQQLEAIRFAAEEWRADGVGHYYSAKRDKLQELEENRVAQTARGEIAKAMCARALWARERTAGLCNAVVSRAFKVDSELKRLGIQG